MATAKELRRIALSLEGTREAPHFDRTAFKVVRIYATLAAVMHFSACSSGANLRFAVLPSAAEAFSRIANAWGDQGWTTVTLSAVTIAELKHALEMAWQHGRAPAGQRRRR